MITVINTTTIINTKRTNTLDSFDMVLIRDSFCITLQKTIKKNPKTADNTSLSKSRYAFIESAYDILQSII